MRENQFTRIPPQALDAEMAVLGGMMIDPFGLDTAVNKMKAEYFYKEAHKKIFEACLILDSKDEPVDVLTVSNQLESVEDLEAVGGHYYLTELVERIPSAANIDYYCNIVIEKGLRRIFLTSARDFTDKLYGDHELDIHEIVHNYVSEIEDVDSSQAIEIEVVSSVNIRKVHYDIITGRLNNPKEFIKIGYPEMDEMMPFGLIKPGASLLAARPKMGKTTAAMNIVYNIIEAGGSAIVWSPEMNNVRCVDLMASIDSGLGVEKFFLKEHLNNPTIREALVQFTAKWRDNWKLRIFDKLPMSSVDLFHTVARMLSEEPADLFVLDMGIYLTEILLEQNAASKSYAVAIVVQKAIAFARKFNIHVLFVWQLNKAIESRRGKSKKPQLGDVGLSDGLIGAVDQVFMLHRPKYYDINLNDDILEFLIKAQRGGAGRLGEVELMMNRGNRLEQLNNAGDELDSDKPLFLNTDNF